MGDRSRPLLAPARGAAAVPSAVLRGDSGLPSLEWLWREKPVHVMASEAQGSAVDLRPPCSSSVRMPCRMPLTLPPAGSRVLRAAPGVTSIAGRQIDGFKDTQNERGLTIFRAHFLRQPR